MIDSITLQDVPYSQDPQNEQSYVGWYRNGEKPLSGGNADGDYSGILNRPVWHLYNNIDVIDSNTKDISVTLNDVIVEVNTISDLLDTITDFTDLLDQVSDLSQQVSGISSTVDTLVIDVSDNGDSLTTLQNDFTTLSSNFDEAVINITGVEDSISDINDIVGERNQNDSTSRSVLEDLWYIKTVIGNYEDYNVNGDVSLDNEPSGIKARINDIASDVNDTKTDVTTNSDNISTLQGQVGSDTLGQETGLELRTLVLQNEMKRLTSYGGVRLSVNASPTIISSDNTMTPIIIDESTPMSVNRNIDINDQTITVNESGAYQLSANILLGDSALSNQWVEFEVYRNNLATGINSYTRLYNDGRGFATISEPLMIQEGDQISLRVALMDTTGEILIEDFSLYISPM